MALTENGWPGLPASEDMLNWVTVPGTNVKLQIQKGQPTQILSAFCADFNEFVEPLRDPDTACYTRENSVWNSNHRSGTAVDLNWDSHPFHVRNAGFPPDKVAKMRELLHFYEDLVWWGEDWGEQGIGPFDAMHIQMNGNTYNSPRTADFIRRKIRPDGFSTYKRPDFKVADQKVQVATMQKVLTWDKSITSQERYWSCGPATTQILLSIRGIQVSEDELIRVVGATTNGTDAISQIELRALDRFCPEAQYTTVWLPHDPPSEQQRDQFWHDLKASIDHGYGVAMNWVSPPNNPPRPVHGSTKIPGFYGKSTIYHYIAAVGYAEENGERFVAIGDPGGAPNEYFVTLEQCVVLMAPKGYVWAAAFQPEAPKTEPPTHAQETKPQTPVVAPSVHAEAVKAVDQGVEWSAFLGEPEAILVVLRSALSDDPNVKSRAVRVLKVVPKDALQLVALQVRGS